VRILGCRFLMVSAIALWPWLGLNAQTINLSADLSTTADTPEASVAAQMSGICSRLSGLSTTTTGQAQLLSACTELNDASNDFSERVNGLVAVSAKASTAQVTAATRNTLGNQGTFVGQRLNALRKGLALEGLSGVSFHLNEQLLVDEPAWGYSGGAAGDEDGASGFSGYVNGGFSVSEQAATSHLVGYDADAFSVLLGGDYRLSRNAVAGMGVHYLTNTLDLSHNQGQLDGDGYGLLFYGSYFPEDDWFIEASLHVGSSSYDMSRKVDFSINNINFNEVADSATDADVFELSFSGGYDMALEGGLQLLLSGELRYLASEIDAYSETGGGGFDLSLASQEIEQTLLTLSMQFNKAISTANGVVIPSFRFSLINDLSADEQDITASFVNDPGNVPFTFTTPTRDSFYVELAAGVSIYLVNDAAVYAQVESVQLLDDYEQLALSFGYRQDI